MKAARIGTVVGIMGLMSLVLAGRSPAVESQHSSTDTRQRLVLPRAQRDKILAEMRLMLMSVSGIVQGLATGDLPAAEQAARASGIAEAADVDPHIASLLPQQFLELGMRTHRGFDILADQIRAGGSQADMIRGLAALTGNCVACHAVYRLDEKR